MECFTLFFDYKGSRYFGYDYLQPVAHESTQDTLPSIVHAPLTLIFKMAQGGFDFLFCL